jgi:protein-S-isoprenylcysteine O-methyltransferase Ste14
VTDAPPSIPRTRGFWFGAIAFVGLLAGTQVVPTTPSAGMRAVAVATLAVAAVFIFLPFWQLPRHGAARPGAAYMETRTVAWYGLYAIVRHPQYLGYVLLGWGLAASAPAWLTMLAALLVTLGFRRQAKDEERYCLDRFGKEYEVYMLAVPRFDPIRGLIWYLGRRRRSGS